MFMNGRACDWEVTTPDLREDEKMGDTSRGAAKTPPEQRTDHVIYQVIHPHLDKH